MKSHDVFPVLTSILVIIFVAIIQKHSKLAAAITATMPINAPLALWIVYSSVKGEGSQVTQFTLGILLSSLPGVGFLVAAWIVSRAGMSLVPIILSGYATWGILIALLIGARRLFGFP